MSSPSEPRIPEPLGRGVVKSEHYCFCELAPLYALDLLSAEEQRWVEAQTLACPDLAEELREYQHAVTALPYAIPAVPVASDLKQRLFDRLDLDLGQNIPVSPGLSPETASSPETALNLATTPIGPEFITLRSQEIKWRPYLMPGVFIALFHQDKVLRKVVGILRADPGVHYPLHRHADVEEMYMLSGDLIIGDQVYGEGDYIRSAPGSMHSPYTETGCQFFFRSSMDDEYDLVSA